MGWSRTVARAGRRARVVWRIAAWLCLPVAAVLAQPSPATSRFRSLNYEDGLSQSSALAIAQDREGFLWIGTQIGLNRYDGAEFRTFSRLRSADASETQHDVAALLPDADGTLWVGTLDGLHRFDPGVERFLPFAATGPAAGALAHEKINALTRTRDGALWIGSDGGLSRFDSGSHEVLRFVSGLVDPRVQAIVEDENNALWVGTAAGLYRLEPGSSRLLPIEIGIDTGAPGERQGQSIQALRRDRSGVLWIGTRDAGLLRYDPRTKALRQWRHNAADLGSLSHDRVYALLEDRAGRLWIGTEAGADLMIGGTAAGPHFTRFQHRTQQGSSLGAGRVVSLLQDAADNLWFGTWSGGASLLTPVRSRFLSFEVGTDAAATTDAAEVVHMTPADRDHIWLGTRRGLFEFDLGHYSMRPARATLGMLTYAVARDGETLLLGTDQGVFRYDPAADRVTNVILPGTLGRPFIDFIQVEAEHVWISTRDAELFVLDRGLGTVLAHHRLDSRAHFLSDFDADTKILGGDKGLYWISRDGRQVRARSRANLRDASALQSDTCHYFARGRDGRLWVATAAGLHRMQLDASGNPASARFSNIRREGGARANALKSVLEDRSGRLWLSSNDGIARFDPDSGRFTAYGSADGAIDRGYYAFVHAVAADGRMAFGGASGFTVFDPEAIHDLPPPPRPLLTRLELDNVPEEPDAAGTGLLTGPLHRASRLVLPPGRARSIGITFASPYFVAPEHLRFAYRLDGFDTDWIERGPGQRHASFTNLAPGEYRFRTRVRAADADWSGAESELTILVQPYWWQTGWARGAALAGLVAVVFALFQARLRGLALARRRLEVQVAERTSRLHVAVTETQQALSKLHETHGALEKAYVRIDQLSRTDDLTGLGNRRSFEQRLPALLASTVPGDARGGDLWIAVFLLDVDRFKSINDRHGHATGDAVLAALGAFLGSGVREPGFVVRWGGEEFLGLLPVSGPGEAWTLCEALRSGAAALRVAVGAEAEPRPDDTLRTTVSIGFACRFVGADASALRWEHMIDLADAALYAAKHEGRDRVVGCQLEPDAEHAPPQRVQAPGSGEPPEGGVT